MGIPYVFCPGQQTVSLTPQQLSDGVNGAKCVIGNDYEMELIASKTGHSSESLSSLAEIVITTFGSRGSRIVKDGETVEIEAVTPSRVADPTGAGDAYLAGIALGIARGNSPQDFGRIAALAASHAIEEYGTQVHTYTPAEFAEECVAVYGEDLLRLG